MFVWVWVFFCCGSPGNKWELPEVLSRVMKHDWVFSRGKDEARAMAGAGAGAEVGGWEWELGLGEGFALGWGGVLNWSSTYIHV